MLLAANLYYFSLVRPFLDALHQSTSNRIATHVIPFLTIAFGIPDHVVKETTLPHF